VKKKFDAVVFLLIFNLQHLFQVLFLHLFWLCFLLANCNPSLLILGSSFPKPFFQPQIELLLDFPQS
jgi:hypothetical protein